MPQLSELPLENIPLFKGLAPAALRILASAPRRHFAPESVLWTAGMEARGFIIVLSGNVRVVRTRDGRQYSVHSEGPGGTLGDVPFFSGGKYPATAIATEATVCLMLQRDILTRAITADSGLAFELLSRLSGRVRTLVERLDEQQSLTVNQRLARLLLRCDTVHNQQPFLLAATQAEAAEEIGTVREVLVRTLRQFRAAGLVDTPARGRYRVRKRAALQKMAAR